MLTELVVWQIEIWPKFKKFIPDDPGLTLPRNNRQWGFLNSGGVFFSVGPSLKSWAVATFSCVPPPAGCICPSTDLITGPTQGPVLPPAKHFLMFALMACGSTLLSTIRYIQVSPRFKSWQQLLQLYCQLKLPACDLIFTFPRLAQMANYALGRKRRWVNRCCSWSIRKIYFKVIVFKDPAPAATSTPERKASTSSVETAVQVWSLSTWLRNWM